MCFRIFHTRLLKLDIFSCFLSTILLVLVSLRFFQIETDPPYGIVSWSSDVFTDEGWWTKNAQIWAKFGEFRNQYDSNLYIDSIAFAVLMAVLFKVFGASIVVARYSAVIASSMSLVVLYFITRRSLRPEFALLVVIASAVTLHEVAYSRMALIEPFGTMVSLMSIYLLIAGKDDLRYEFSALGFGVLSVLMKTTFYFTLFVVCTVLLLRVFFCFKDRNYRAVFIRFQYVFFWLVVLIAIKLALRYQFSEDTIVSDYAVGSRLEGASVATITNNLYRAFYYLLFSYHWIVLSTSAFVALFLCVGHRAALRAFPISTDVVVVSFWMLAGICMFGSVTYQAPRYFYFVSFAIPFTFAVLCERWLALMGKTKLFTAILGTFVIGHIAMQTTAFRLWFTNNTASSYIEAAHAFAEQIDSDAQTNREEPIVAMGAISSFVSFFNVRLRPTDFRPIAPFPVEQSKELIQREDGICDRARYWKPRYTIGPETVTPRLLTECPSLVSVETEIARQPVMGGWYYGSDFVVRRVTYRPVPLD